MELLERESHLDTLAAVLREAATGSGQVFLVSGEAGIGKTSLIERFTAEHRQSARVLWGTCDALFTPRPLGPLYDIAHQTQGRLLSLLNAEANRTALFSAALQELQAQPTIVIIEDAHWADEATLDLIKFLGRRIQRASAMLIVTFRDDELSADHPLWFSLGELPAQAVRRLKLFPLSEQAVATLAKYRGRSAEGLYGLTAGNPFFVSAVLSNENGRVPATVREAVLARVARLAPEARQMLDLVSVVPPRIERWLLEALMPPAPSVLEACLRTGLIRAEPEALAFRHELARQAVEDTLPPARQQNLHAQVVQAVVGRGTEPAPLARIVHHARLAGDGALVLQFAPLAARQAAAVGAHREAAAHYQTALQYADRLTTEARAELLQSRSNECFLTGQVEEALHAGQQALAIWRRLIRPDKAGDCLRRLARVAWYHGQNELSDRWTAEAVRVLETMPPSPALAMAYSQRAGVYMQAQQTAAAVELGSRAIELAERLGATEALVHALSNVGMAEWWAGDEAGRLKLERSLQLALAHDMQEQAARTYSNLLECAACRRDYQRAMDYFRAGIAYATERNLFTVSLCQRYWLARVNFEQGRWNEAAQGASAILTAPHGGAVFRLVAKAVLGHIRVRRGDPGAAELLDEGRDLALATGELGRIAQVSAARAEAAWLGGDLERVRAEAGPGFELALRIATDPWVLGQMAFWMWRAGALPEPPEGLAAPYALHIAGDWRAAAEAWEQIGCPYERALALADGDQAAQLNALAIFEQLGAAPAADMLRQKMRAKGIRNLPRGPRPATREHPFGLTAREAEILALLTEDLSNAEIAGRLHISSKTVDHHVSALMAKLDVHTRSAAVQAALQQGQLLPK